MKISQDILNRLLAVAFCVVSGGVSTAGQTPELRTDGDTFTVNGTPRFLLFVSYFDAMRRSNAGGANLGDLDTDFRFLKNAGIDGIRIFPNWWIYACGASPVPAPHDSLLTATGALNASQWPVFLRVLDRASAHGLLVDISFARETVSHPGMTVAQYQSGLMTIVDRLRGRYPNALVDVQNEFNGGRQTLTVAEVADILARLRSVDPTRLLTASGTSGLAAAAMPHSSMDLIAYHDARSDGWYREDVVGAAVRANKAALEAVAKPIYHQEPNSFSALEPDCPGDYETDRKRALIAVANARRAGAAAWTLHMRYGFALGASTLKEKLDKDVPLREVIENLRSEIDRVTWDAPRHEFTPRAGFARRVIRGPEEEDPRDPATRPARGSAAR